ncbi:MAG: hotdog fold thioesterase [Nostocoides sp.]
MTDANVPSIDPLVTEMATMSQGSLLERMQIELTVVQPDHIEARMPVAGNTQPYGLLHGGASVVLAESLGSIGSALHAGADRIAVGLDINATHHRAARSGFVTAVARPLSLGSTICSWEVVVRDEMDRRICTSRITCLIRERPPGEPTA